MIYYSNSGAYLNRAEACLKKERSDFLFYAAFELRCFVECRLQQYLEAQKEYRRTLPKRWKIGSQAKELNRIFNLNKIQKITQSFEDGFELVANYIPVSELLKSDAEKLGDLLHSQKDNLSKEKIAGIRVRLKNMFDRAYECDSGSLLNPMLKDKSTGKPIGKLIQILEQDNVEELQKRLKTGAKEVIKVEYVDFKL